jgi:F-type H+-transporting ATPase subunit b
MSILMSTMAEGAVHAAEHGADAAHAAHATWLGLGPVGWLLVSTILFIGLLIYLKAHHSITRMLDERIARIRAQLAEAEALRTEAEKLKADLEAQKADADRQAAAILAQARSDADAMVANAKAQAEATIARRTQMASDRIAAAERSAADEVRATAVAIATAAAKSLLASKLPGQTQADLVDQAIADLDRRLH